MSRYKSRIMSWGVTLLSTLFVMGALPMTAVAQEIEFDSPRAFDPGPPVVEAVPYSVVPQDAVPDDRVEVELAILLGDRAGTVGQFRDSGTLIPVDDADFVGVGTVFFGSSARVGESGIGALIDGRVRYTMGANVRDAFGSVGVNGFVRTDPPRAVVNYYAAASGQVGNTDQHVLGWFVVPFIDPPLGDARFPALLTDYPFSNDALVDAQSIMQLPGATMTLTELFKRNFRNVGDAWRNPGVIQTYADFTAAPNPGAIVVNADLVNPDIGYTVTDKDGNVTDIVRAYLVLAPLPPGVPAPGIRFELNEEDGYTAADAVAAQPFSLTYEADGIAGNPATRSSATLTLDFARVGLLRQNIQKTVPNVTGAEVQIRLSDIIDAAGGQLPDGWSHQILTVPANIGLANLTYPRGSLYEGSPLPPPPTPGHPGSVEINADRDRVTYTHTAVATPIPAAQLYRYVYINVVTRRPTVPGPGSENVWITSIQVRIALQPESDTALSEQAVAFDYETLPHQPVFDVPWFDQGLPIPIDRAGILQDGRGNTRRGSYGLNIRLVDGDDDVAGVYEEDPESIFIRTWGAEGFGAFPGAPLPPQRLVPPANVVQSAFYGEELVGVELLPHLLIITDQGGVVRYDRITPRLIYTPPRGFTGVDSFEYTITDGTYIDADTLNTASATVTITVPEDAFLIQALEAPDEWEFLVDIDNPSAIGNLNALDALGAVIPNSQWAVPGSGPSSGTMNWARQAAGNIGIMNADFIYTPNAGFTGTDSFEFQEWILVAGNRYWTEASDVIFVVTDAVGADEDERRPLIEFGPVYSSYPGATWVRVWVGRDGAAFHSEWLAPWEIERWEPAQNAWVKYYEPRQLWRPIAGLPGGRYEFWVLPWGPQMGYGNWELVREYQLMTRAPGQVDLLAPIGGEYVPTPNVTYRWTHDRDATWYRIWIEQDGIRMIDRWLRMGDGVVNVPVINQVISGHHAPTDYQWWILPWGPDGYGPWTEEGARFTRNPDVVVDDDDDNDDE